MSGPPIKRKRDELDGEFGFESANRPPHDFLDSSGHENEDFGGCSLDIETTYEKENIDVAVSKNVEEEEVEGDADEMNVYDEEKFFMSPSFSREELIESSKRIVPIFEKQLSILEKGGWPAYAKYLADREKEKAGAIDNKADKMPRMIEDTTIKGDPHEYQRALFVIAKSKNTIINLGTGFGKSLISILCIRHHSSSFQEGKQTLFLVPSDELAIQQSATLRANLPNFSTQAACYDSSNTNGARESLAKANIMVATHGAILDMLQHYADIFTMSKFNLLVVDECHYATGNHPYSLIMNKFYHTIPKEDRPHILGLTASPLINVRESHTDEQLNAMLTNLEKAMDSTLASVSSLIPHESSILVKSAKEKVMPSSVRMHSLGLLNNILLPLTGKDMQDHILRVATRKLEHITTQELPRNDFFTENGIQVFVYPIDQKGEAFEKYERCFSGKSHKLAFLSTEPLPVVMPSFQLHHAELGTIISSLGEMSTVNISEEERFILDEVFVLMMDERWRRRSRNMHFRMREKDEYTRVFLPYLVGIISSEGTLDWSFMRLLVTESQRSKEERTAAVRNKSSTSTMTEPRLWAPLYDEHVPYVSFGPATETCASPFPHEREDVSTYHEYYLNKRNFEVPKESALFDAQRVWSLPADLSTWDDHQFTENVDKGMKSEHTRHEMCKDIALVKLAQEACFEPVLANVHVSLLCCMLPQFLFLYERYLNTAAFIQHCKDHTPILGESLSNMTLEKVANSLTSKSCNLSDSYEKLEYFGDSVLKIVQTDALIKSIELRSFVGFLHEGDLSTFRSVMGSNHSLEKVCRHHEFHQFIMISALARGQWLPSCMTFKEGTDFRKEDEMGPKAYADIIESVLGLVFLECGFETSMKVADELRVTVPWSESEHLPSGFEESPGLSEAISNCTGYRKFRRKELIIEAFTHPSALSTEVSSYQRLEWIGDAVLCIAVRKWIYENFKEITLGEMVVIEAAVVSNETLAFLAVRYGLQHHLDHRDYSLPSRIEAYTSGVREYGTGLWGTDPPKSISDMAEAIIGSVHVDGGFVEGQTACLQFMSPVLNVLLKARKKNKDICFKHPRKIMQEMGGELLELNVNRESDLVISEGGTEISFPGGKWGQASRDGSSHVASVSILGSIVAGVSNPSATVAKNKVCALTVCTLEANPGLRDRLQTCRSRIKSGQTCHLKALTEK